MYNNRVGFGFEPVSATIAATKVIGAAGGLISTIGSWFGIAPRGDLQKFNRTHYPYMRTLAAKDGYNVYCFWFGDVVVVSPNGDYGVALGVDELNSRLGSPIPPQAALDLIPEVDPDTFYYVLRNSSPDPVNTPSADYFELYYNGTRVENEEAIYAIQSGTGGAGGAGATNGTYIPPYGSSGERSYPPPYSTTDYPPPGAYQQSILPSGWQEMLPLIILGGLAAVIAFSGPYQERKPKKTRSGII